MARPLRIVLLASMLASVALAGCSSSDSTETVTGTGIGSTETIDVRPTATTGIIKGIVVDSAIRPVAGAILTVQTQDGTLTTNSTTAGAFGFEGLKPGTYFVKASKGGFLSVQASVEVEAGDADPPALKIQMENDASYIAPFFQKHSFNGFVECSVGAAGTGAAVCAIPNNSCLPDPIFGIVCVAKTPTVTNDQFSNFIELDAGAPTFIQGEVIWESTQAAGNTFNLFVRTSTPELHGDGFYRDNINNTEGTSPLLFKLNKKGIDDFALGMNGTGLELDVFTAEGVCEPGGQVCAAGATFQQTFQIITHIFYGFRPDPSYRFTEHGDPTVPK